MRIFKIKPKIGSGDFILIERILDKQIPQEIKQYLFQLAGHSFFENVLIDKIGKEWEVQQYASGVEILKLVKEFKNSNWGAKMVFAFDPGGWHYCLSFDEDTFGKILINRWTDHLPEEQFVVVADSFEEFINRLQERSDHLK